MSSKRSSYHRKGHSGGGSSRGDDQPSDSGLGSLSDTESMIANPDRTFTANDYEEQFNNIAALREALCAANNDNAILKARCEQFDAELARKNKECREIEAHRKTLFDRLGHLEEEYKELENENKSLKTKVEILQEDLQTLTETRSPRSRRESPMMSGAAGPAPTSPIYDERRPKSPQRTASTRKGNGKTNAEKEKDDQKRRMQQRFERDEQNSQTSSQGRRAPYIEKLGPGGRRRSSSVAPAPTPVPRGSRGGAAAGYGSGNYTVAANQAAPVYASRATPTFTYSSVPRTVPAREQERETYVTDGTYQGHDIPLPEPRGRERRSRR